jgi:hypothetical protein
MAEIYRRIERPAEAKAFAERAAAIRELKR